MTKNTGGSWESVSVVKGGENGTKVFVNIADHYWNKNKGEQVTRFVPMQGFVPRNLTIEVGMLVDVEYVINTYTKDNISNVSMDIMHWDVSLRSANKQQAEQQTVVSEPVQEEIPEQPKKTARPRTKANAKKSAA